jgi:hypothetical protein
LDHHLPRNGISCRIFIGWVAFVIVRPTQELRAVVKPGPSQILAITLKRQGCPDAELECPVYDVTFHSDGTATYIGYANDEFIGTYTSQYSQQDFAYLVEQLQRERLFDLPHVYPAAPVEETQVLEVLTSDGSRVLTTSNWESTPAELRALQALVDRQTFEVEWEKVETP